MSICKQFGKDKIIFLTKEDHSKPSTVTLVEDDDEPRGLILANGEINWNCPCLGGMASGPCGVQFREAFSCFHHSIKDESKEKGAECIEKFVAMHECMSKYPNVYPRDKDDDDDDSADFQKMVDEDPGKKENTVESGAPADSITDNPSEKQLKS